MKNRKSFVVSLARILQRLPLGAFVSLEKIIATSNNDIEQCDLDMIVLLAAPRSGSTLTYQCFMEATNVLGLTNFGNLLFRMPLFGLLLQEVICQHSRSKFSSSEGFVRGICGSSEGMMFWSKWSSSPMDERCITSDKSSCSHFKTVARYLANKIGRPLMGGYLGHSLNVDGLHNEFPGIRCVVLFRDPIETALSLLKVRRNAGNQWVSVFPKECEHVVRRDIFAQVMAQVYWVNRRLLNCINDKRSVTLHYDELCSDPNGTIARLVRELHSTGSSISIKHDLPNKFASREIDVMSSDYSKLKQQLDYFERQYGRLEIPKRKFMD